MLKVEKTMWSANRSAGFILFLTILVLSLVGCNSIDNQLSQPSVKEATSAANDINQPSEVVEEGQPMAKLESKSICEKISGEKWKKRCLAYQDKNPTYCEAFDSNEQDNCYYDLAIGASSPNTCSEIDNLRFKWECRAITNKDITQCDF